MKICIVTTPIRPTPTNFPPLGSMVIIQSLWKVLPKENIKFYHIDYHRYSHEENIEYFKKNKFDMVGISAVVSTAYAYTKYLSKLIKSIKSDTIVFVGGGLATSAKILHRKANIDFTVIGNGEIIVQNLVRFLVNKKNKYENLENIKGITFIDKNDKFRFTGYEHSLPADLLEFPDFSILEEDKSIDYYISNRYVKLIDSNETKNKKSVVIVVAKGCVARCTFCHRFEKGYRVNSNDKVINYIKFLKKKYDIDHIAIGDENFGSYKQQTLDLVKQINSLDLTWTAGGVRAQTIDSEMLKIWKKNGCQMITFGIESGSPTMLEVMEKKITLEKNIAALKATYEAGLFTTIQLVIGMPGETDKTINETIDFIINTMDYYPEIFKDKLNYLLSTNYAQALPGTPLYEYAREKGFLGNNMDAEEKYLIDISNKDAYDNDHFINYTQQPLLKVYSWRYLMNWKVFREHNKRHLKINLTKWELFYGITLMTINKIFKTKINNKLEKSLNKFINAGWQNPNFNFTKTTRIIEGVKLLFPWNKYTYPFISLIIAFRESNNIKWFFKLIFEHLVWSTKKFNDNDLPKKTLRKIVNIKDNDDTIELRKGR